MSEPWDDEGLLHVSMPLPPRFVEGLERRKDAVREGLCPDCGAGLNEGACHVCGIAYTLIEQDGRYSLTEWWIA